MHERPGAPDPAPAAVRPGGRDGPDLLPALLTRGAFDALVAARSDDGALVSLYVPTQRRGPQIEAGAIQLEHVLARARRLAGEAGHRAADVAGRLAPLEGLVEDELFWRHQADGLALFASSDGARAHALDHPVEAFACVADRFAVRPLLPSISAGERFQLLALSRRRVRLLDCSREHARELDLDAAWLMPGPHHPDPSLQFHTGTPPAGDGERAAMFHGHGLGRDDRMGDLERFLRHIDTAVQRLLPDPDAPLVLGGVSEVVAAFQRVSRHARLVDPGLTGNFEHLDADALAARGRDALGPWFDEPRRRAVDAVQQAAHSDRVARGIESTLRALAVARVDLLLARAEAPLWGRVLDATSARVEVHDERHPGDDDLLDLAIHRAVATGARVQAARAGEIPDGLPVAALLRF